MRRFLHSHNVPALHDRHTLLHSSSFTVYLYHCSGNKKNAIAAVERFWAKALIYFVLSAYPVPKAFGTGQLFKSFNGRSNKSTEQVQSHSPFRVHRSV